MAQGGPKLGDGFRQVTYDILIFLGIVSYLRNGDSAADRLAIGRFTYGRLSKAVSKEGRRLKRKQAAGHKP